MKKTLFLERFLLPAALCLLFQCGCEQNTPPRETTPPAAQESLEQNDESASSTPDADSVVPAETPAAAPAQSAGLLDDEKIAQDLKEIGFQEDSDTMDAETLDRYVNDDEFMAKTLPAGELLVDNPDALVRLDPEKTIWVDKEKRHVVMQGWICQNRAALEFFICFGRGYQRIFPFRDESREPEVMLQFNGPKCHESVIAVDIPPSVIHAALLAIGAEEGAPARFQPFSPPTGDEIEILVRWKDEKNETKEYRGQDLILDQNEEKPMAFPWVFAGSMFYEDDEGTKRYAADSEGEIVSVANFPSSILDVPSRSSNSDMELLFFTNERVLPERGYPVTIIMKKAEKKDAQ